MVLRQNRGMRRATKVDTVGAGFAGVSDGSLPAGRILDAIAQLVGEDPVLLRDRTPGVDPDAGRAGVPGAGGRGRLTGAGERCGAGGRRSSGVRRDAASGRHAARMESGPEVFAGAAFALFGAGLLVWTGVCARTGAPVAEGAGGRWGR